MWSVWSERVDLYLGQGLVLLRAGRSEPQVIRQPLTMPLDRLFDKAGEAVDQMRSANGWRRRLHVSLSGALCPAIGFTFPPDVVRWHERREIARSAAAARMDASADEIHCEFDPRRPGVAGAVGPMLLRQLRDWAARHHLRVASIQPLWAVATTGPLVRQQGKRALVIQEPDALTLLADDDKVGMTGATLPLEGDMAARDSQVRRWLLGAGIGEEQVLRLGFGMTPGAALPGGPYRWAEHWSCI